MADYSNSRWKERGSFSKNILHSYQDIVDAIRTAPYGVDTREAMAQMLIFLYSTVQSMGDGFGVDMSPTDAFKNLAELKARYPNGQQGVFVTQDDGRWWFWSELENIWKDGGFYQASAPIDDIRAVDAKATSNENLLKSLLADLTKEVTERKKIGADLAQVHSAIEPKPVSLIDNVDQVTLVDSDGSELQANFFFPITDDSLTKEFVPANAYSVGKKINQIESKFNSVDVSIADNDGNPIFTNDFSMVKITEKTVDPRNFDFAAYEKLFYLSSSKNFNNFEKPEVPILKLYGTIPASDDAKETERIIFEQEKIDEEISAKWQGQSSKKFPKKNWNLSFKEPIKLHSNWPTSKKLTIKGNFNDFTQSRNLVSAGIWGKLVQSRADDFADVIDNNGDTLLDNDSATLLSISGFSGLPNGGGVQGYPIMLVWNDNYMGLHTLQVHKDETMFGINSDDTNTFVVSAENKSNFAATAFRGLANLDGDDYSVEYASDNVESATVQKSLNSMLQAVLDIKDEESYRLASKYIDVDSAIDYILMTTAFGAIDDIFKNFLLVTFDSKKWFLSAYDLDCTFGNYQDGGLEVMPGAVTLDYWAKHNSLAQAIMTYDVKKLKARYEDLEKTYLSENYLYRCLISFTRPISKALKDEEVKLWPTQFGTDVSTVSQMLSWYQLNKKLVDVEVKEL